MRYDIILCWIHCLSFGHKGTRAFQFQLRCKICNKRPMSSCPECIGKQFSVYDSTVLKECHIGYEAKTEEVLLAIKKQNPKLSRRLYASGSSFLRNVY